MRNRHVLIMEEDASLRQMLEEYLGHFDLRVFAVPEWDSALPVIKDQNLSVAVCGMSLDTSAGLDWITRFRSARPDMQNIILIGEPSLDFMIRAVRERVWDVIIKPFRLESLYASIQGALTSPPYHELISQLQGRVEELELQYRRGSYQPSPDTPPDIEQNGTRVGRSRRRPEGKAVIKAVGS